MRLQPLAFTMIIAVSFAAAQTKAPVTTPKPAAKTQSQPSKPSTPAAKPAPATSAGEVPETAAVLTINGVCEGKPAAAGECKTVITRAQFEKILSAVAPARAGSTAQLPPGVKRSIATQYSQLLTVANDAEKQGVQNTPEAQQLLKFARMQALAQAYSRQLQKKFEPTDAEVKTFYDANAAKLQQATVERLVIPKAAPTNAKGADAKATDDADKANAEKFRARAVAGESMDALQKEAIQGTTTKNAPETKMVVQKGTLPPDQDAVFSLKPGEVSQVFSSPGAFFIYKMDSNGPIPLDQVKNEIQQQLLKEKMQAAMESMVSNAKPVLNEQYFGPAPSPTQVVPGTNAPSQGAQPTTQKPPQSSTAKPKSESQPK
jgi:peptidyl-prolyl cis-trans isomerase C